MGGRSARGRKWSPVAQEASEAPTSTREWNEPTTTNKNRHRSGAETGDWHERSDVETIEKRSHLSKLPAPAVRGKKAQKKRNQRPPRRSEAATHHRGRTTYRRGGQNTEKERGAALGGLGTAQKKRPMVTKPRKDEKPTIRGRGATCGAGRARRPEERKENPRSTAESLKSVGGGGQTPKAEHKQQTDTINDRVSRAWVWGF